MCIGVFLWKAHPVYPFLLLLNRDEHHHRPTRALGWWGDKETVDEVVGGRDELAGGTWLACNRKGKIAFITNVRQPPSEQNPGAKSRGHLPLRFLQSDMSPKDFAVELVKEAHQYNGFNLILVDICTKSMVYITNGRNSENCLVTEVLPGMHVLSNASLDTPWPKALRLGQSLKDVLDKYGEAELPAKEMAETLMTDKTKDDISMLPGILNADWEYAASSIFVQTETPLGQYGTRSTSVLSVKSCGEVNFYERYLDKERWEEQTVSYQIEKADIIH